MSEENATAKETAQAALNAIAKICQFPSGESLGFFETRCKVLAALIENPRSIETLGDIAGNSEVNE